MFRNNKARRIAAVLATALPIVAAGALAAQATATDGGAESAVIAHHAYVAIVTNKGEFEASDATMLATLDAALARWQVETAGRATFDRVGSPVRFQTDLACDPDLRGALRTEAAKNFPGITFGGSGHNDLIVLQPTCFGSSQGIGGESLDNASGRASVSYVTIKGIQSAMHELGHTFGLDHAYAEVCEDGSCVPTEYANDYDIMGHTMTGTPAWVPAAFDTYELDVLGLGERTGMRTLSLPADVRRSTTTVDLAGRGAESGTRGAKIVDPVTGETYYLDFRNGVGRDAGAWYATGSKPKHDEYFNKGVTIQKVVKNAKNNPVSLLQAYPQQDGTGYRYAKVGGESFTAGNVEIEVLETQLNGSERDLAKLRVTLTNPSVPASPQAVLNETLSGTLGSTSYFTVDVPQGATDLTFRLIAGSGDPDLYTRFGAQPDRATYDCRPYKTAGANELCTVPAPAPGKYELMIYGYKAYADFTLTATYTY